MVLFWNSKHMIRQSLQKCHKKVRGTFNRTFQTKKNFFSERTERCSYYSYYIQQRAFNPHKISLRSRGSTGVFSYSDIVSCFNFHIKYVPALCFLM